MQAETRPAVHYESYILRLRRTMGPEGRSNQVYLQGVRDDGEHYFSSLSELVAWLRAEGRLPPERDVDAGEASESDEADSGTSRKGE